MERIDDPDVRCGLPCSGVSIPFKRESVMESSENIWEHADDTNRFNSLQTGKFMESEFIGDADFNIIKVSIPFKRESS